MDTNNKRVARRRFVIESLGLIFIALSPFIFKLHDYLPEDPEATFNIFGLIIDKNNFADISTYIYFLLSKLVPLYLLVIWFFTCKHWWYHIILIPLCMYAFQIFEVVYYQDEYVDTDNVMWLLPICMVVIPFVYFVRLKLYDKYVHGIDLEAMDLELQLYKEKEKQKNSKYQVQEDLQIKKEADLSEKVTNKTLLNLFRPFQHSLKNLFNFML